MLQRWNVGPSPEVKRLVNPTECWQGCNGWALLGGTAEWNGLLKIVKRGKRNISLLRFSGIGCGKGCLSWGVIQKGPFCPCGEWRGDGLLSSRSELRFDRTVHIACSDKHWVFLQKTADFQKAKPFANKNTCRKDCIDCRISSTGIILSGSYHSQDFADGPFPSGSPSSYEPDTYCSWFQAL